MGYSQADEAKAHVRLLDGIAADLVDKNTAIRLTRVHPVLPGVIMHIIDPLRLLKGFAVVRGWEKVNGGDVAEQWREISFAQRQPWTNRIETH